MFFEQRKAFLIISTCTSILFGSLALLSCGRNTCGGAETFDQIDVELKVDRLEQVLPRAKSVERMLELLQTHRIMATFFLNARQYPNDTLLARRLFRLMQQPAIDTLIRETDAYFSNFDQIILQLERAYGFIKYHYPETVIPRVQTIVTGFYQDMYISDSLIVLGLDYFAVTQGRYQPKDVPLYIVKRYKKERVAPIVLRYLSNDYNTIDDVHNTLLSEMINHGKAYYFVEKTLPCMPDSLIIGYSSEEIQRVQTTQARIWATLIENEMLYSTDHFLKKKFIGERPGLPELGAKYPGRVGTWVGWQIVRKYMKENPQVTFQALMAEKNAYQIFEKSGYKPRSGSFE